jgi:signal transduction histidine kinase
MDAGGIDDQLIRSGRMIAIGWLTPAVVHEINNSLLVLLGMADLELAALPPESKERERMESVRDAAGEIREVVSRLAQFTRAPLEGAQRLSLVDVADTTLTLVRRLRLARDVELEESFPDDELPVSASEGQLLQAFLHLLLNAIQISPPGTTVRLALDREGDQAVALVSDSGPGVEPGKEEWIFEPFATTSVEPRAAGLGLAAARAIARRQGGELELRPSSKGAMLALRLPIAG